MLKRNIKITFRVNAKEQQTLQEKVRKCGLSQESYIRTLLSGHVPRELPPLDYHEVMRELSLIGYSMQMITARANATGSILAEDYAFYYQCLMDKVLAIQAAVTLPEKLC